MTTILQQRTQPRVGLGPWTTRNRKRKSLANLLPQRWEFVTSANLQLGGINQHVAEIERTNQIIAEKIESIDNNINGLKKKSWKLPIE